LWHRVDLSTGYWFLGGGGAVLVGLSKTGIPGLGILAIAVYALIFPTRASTGIVLPMLLCGDVVAVIAYRRHAVWSHLFRLAPWVVPGIVGGWLTMRALREDGPVRLLVGVILLGLVALHAWRERRGRSAAGGDRPVPEPGGAGPAPGELPRESSRGFLYVATMGLLAGFTTMVANAAGPVMILYLLAMRLPKMEFVGTSAWFFMTVNLFKVPFSIDANVITAGTFEVTVRLAGFVVLGALLGRATIRYFPQKAFETAALALTVAAAVWLLMRSAAGPSVP
jgi:uncharacterized membrane protein YfcA